MEKGMLKNPKLAMQRAKTIFNTEILDMKHVFISFLIIQK